MNELNNGLLPPDVKVVPYIDRTNLIHTTIHTISRTLFEGLLLVTVVVLLFVGSIRGALLIALTIPLSLLFAFICMHLTNIPANLLSLGAIDFGIIVDGSIVLVETILRRREAHPDAELSEGDARAAALQVARPIFFATLIIITGYLPLFAFQRVERKLFTPMAFTIGYALIGALADRAPADAGYSRTRCIASPGTSMTTGPRPDHDRVKRCCRRWRSGRGWHHPRRHRGRARGRLGRHARPGLPPVSG